MNLSRAYRRATGAELAAAGKKRTSESYIDRSGNIISRRQFENIKAQDKGYENYTDYKRYDKRTGEYTREFKRTVHRVLQYPKLRASFAIKNAKREEVVGFMAVEIEEEGNPKTFMIQTQTYDPHDWNDVTEQIEAILEMLTRYEYRVIMVYYTFVRFKHR